MPSCKKCQSQQITKNGFVRSKQRYRCKGCGYNFVLGDGRTDPQTAVKRAFAVILYSRWKGFVSIYRQAIRCRALARCKNGLPAKLRRLIPLRFPQTAVN